ncbi:hypothetical protein ACFLTQ_00265 [Chloroflexota bacterium]
MIWFRRIIAIGLIFFSLLLFIPALLLTEANNTAASPDFYNDQLERADMYNFIHDEALPAALDEIEEDESSDLPVELADYKSDVVSALREILPPEWLQEQFESATGELIPYFRGSTDEFTINIQVLDKVDPTADAIIEIFGTQQTYDHLLEEIITPMVMEELGAAVDLPFGVSLSQEEISSAIKEILPPAWIHDSFAEIVRACADYAKGADDISVDIDLAENEAAASSFLTSLADQKLEDKFNSLPEVNEAEFLLAIQDLPPGNIPDVRPEGLDYDSFKTAIGLDIGYWVDQMVIDQIPDQWSFTQDDVMTAIGSDLEDALNDARDNIASGYTITEQDLRDEITEGDGNPDDLDQAREIINTGRTWMWLLWAVPLIMLLGAGLLIARSLKGKILWFLGIVFVIFLIFYAAVGVGYFHFAEPEMQSALAAPAEDEGFDAVMTEKGNELIDNALGTFFSGIQRMCLYTMIGSGMVCIAYTGISLGLRRRKKGEVLQDDNDEVLLDENNQVLQGNTDEVLLDENGEVLQDESDDVLQDDNDEVLLDENNQVLQNERNELLLDENGEVLKNEGDEVLQGENDEVLQDENVESLQDENSPEQATSPDSSTKNPED